MRMPISEQRAFVFGPRPGCTAHTHVALASNTRPPETMVRIPSPRVTFALPVHNGEELVARAIESATDMGRFA